MKLNVTTVKKFKDYTETSIITAFPDCITISSHSIQFQCGSQATRIVNLKDTIIEIVKERCENEH